MKNRIFSKILKKKTLQRHIYSNICHLSKHFTPRSTSANSLVPIQRIITEPALLISTPALSLSIITLNTDQSVASERRLMRVTQVCARARNLRGAITRRRTRHRSHKLVFRGLRENLRTRAHVSRIWPLRNSEITCVCVCVCVSVCLSVCVFVERAGNNFARITGLRERERRVGSEVDW